MLRHVQEQHSGFSYKCLICHKVLSRAQVHGQCQGRYRDTEIFYVETGARGWLAKQLFQQYKDNKLNDQWEELFKAPPPPPRRISPLPRTPPSTPPPTDRILTVMTVIDSGRKRKAPTPDVLPSRNLPLHWMTKNGLTYSCLILTMNSLVGMNLRQEPRMSGSHHLLAH